MTMATNAPQKNKKVTQQQKFLKDVKKQKYAKIEKTSIKYSRLSETAQPLSHNQKTVVFYGIR